MPSEAPVQPPPPIKIGGHCFEWGQRSYVMGIVNATPDSFSGDGVLDPAAAADRAARMVEDGADLIDVGAESTRPDHQPLDAAGEWARLAPVLRALREAVSAPISIDTAKAYVAERAFDAGADALNDVHGLRADPALASLLAARELPAVLMHNQRGRPPVGDVIADVRAGLEESLAIAEAAGVRREMLILDPGFGFGIGPQQSLELVRRLGELRCLGRPLLLGSSRKSAIGWALGREQEPPSTRAAGSAATVALAIAAGADIVRVHDVREMADVALVTDAVLHGRRRGDPA
ncbi:MAG: dihydropteroate synthase [Chloroflexi bacterium]|nr:dihydropteroate synthase [Chloroflexota bacterium]